MTLTIDTSTLSTAARSLRLEGLESIIRVGHSQQPLHTVEPSDVRTALTVGANAIVRDYFDGVISRGELLGPLGNVTQMDFLPLREDRYSVHLLAASGSLINDGVRYTGGERGQSPTKVDGASYYLDTNQRPDSFRGVYQARLNHVVLAVNTDGSVERLGRIEELLDESVHSTLAHKFQRGPSSFFRDHIIHNHATSDGLFDGKDPTQLVLTGELQIDDYLARAHYVFIPFDTVAIPQRIVEAGNDGAIRFLEFWRSI